MQSGKTSSEMKVLYQMASKGNSTKHQKRAKTYSSQTTPQKWREYKISKFILEASITLILKLNKDDTERENYRPISLMNIVAPLNKIIEKGIWQYVKRIIQHNQVRFVPGI